MKTLKGTIMAGRLTFTQKGKCKEEIDARQAKVHCLVLVRPRILGVNPLTAVPLLQYATGVYSQMNLNDRWNYILIEIVNSSINQNHAYLFHAFCLFQVLLSTTYLHFYHVLMYIEKYSKHYHFTFWINMQRCIKTNRFPKRTNI